MPFPSTGRFERTLSHSERRRRKMAGKLWVASWVTIFLLTVFQVSTVGAQTKITVGVAAMSPRTIPLLIAQEQGLFAKQGIDARIVLIKGAPTLVASLISGDIEVGYTGGTAVLGAASQGLYLRILSSISSKLTHTIAANPNLKTIEQLRGKSFGIQSIGGSTWMHTILSLEHVGLDVKRDHINLLVIGDSVLIGQSLEAGRIDAAVLDGALVRRLKSRGFTLIADMTPEKILMALVDSIAYTLAPMNKGVVTKTIMQRFHISDPAVAEDGYQDLLTSIERKPLPSLEALRNIRRLMAVQSPKAANVKVEELIDARLIRKLDENGYMDKVAAGYGL